MKALSKERKLPIEICLGIVFIIQFILIAVSNLTMLDKQLDVDTGKLYNHIMCMWEEGTLFIPDWKYSTIMEWDCSSLFALPLYGLTGNVYIAFGLANIIMLVLFTLAVFWLFGDKPKSYPLLAMNLIAVPYSIGMLDYYNMTFFAGGHYDLKILFPILTIGIILHLEKYNTLTQKQKRTLYIVEALYFVLVLITSISSGVYVPACTLVPIFAVYILNKFFRWEKMPIQGIVLIVVSVVLALVGLILNDLIMGGARGQEMVFCSVYQIMGNVFSCFAGIFELMGGATQAMDLSIMSPKGIVTFFKLCLTWLYIGCGIVAVVRCIRRKADLRMLLLVACPIWNYFVLNVINAQAGSSTYEYRYHLVGMIPLICVAVIVLWEGFAKCNKGQQTCLFVVGLLMIAFLNAASFGVLYTKDELNQDLEELCDYCSELDTEVIYLFDGSDDSNMCRVLDRSTLYLCLMGDQKTYVYDYYERYDTAFMQEENAVIVVDDRKHQWSDRYTFGNLTLVRFDTVANRGLYYIE